MSKDERQARYENEWRTLYRPTRRFRRHVRPYWQPNPTRNHRYQRWLRQHMKAS